MTNKKAFIEKDNKRIWLCEYGNCRQPQKEGYTRCEKHIGVKYTNLNSYNFKRKLKKYLFREDLK